MLLSHHLKGHADSSPKWGPALNHTCGQNNATFTPSRVHAVSRSEIFISGNGLLYRYTLEHTSCIRVLRRVPLSEHAVLGSAL